MEKNTFQKRHIYTGRQFLVNPHNLFFEFVFFIFKVFEILRDQEEILEEIESRFERIELFFLLILTENGAVIGQVDIFDCDFGFFGENDLLIFGSIGFDDECSVGFGGVHFDFFAPVVFEAVEHLAFVDAGDIIEELFLILGDLFEDSDLIFADDLFEGVHVEIVQVSKIKIQSGGVLDCLDEVVVFEVLVEDDVVAELGNLYK